MAKKKSAAAVELGRKGGKARGANLSKEELSKIGRQGATKRWGTKKGKQS
jgi:general stress protein YciG